MELSKLFQNVFKVNGYIFRGRNSVIFIFASHINFGHLIKERIYSYRSKFILSGEYPILGRLRVPGKQTRSDENYLPLKRLRKKMEVYPYTLIPEEAKNIF